MILRRFAQSLKEQNWTAITVEFVLLIAGVFLGIQAANWNEVRREQAQEADYVARLERDFREIDARLVNNVSRWRMNAAATGRLLDDLAAFRRDGTWPRAKEPIVRDLADTLNGRLPAPRAATYVELLSAGKLGLLRDTTLRDALQAYDSQTGYTMTAYNLLAERTDPHMTAIIGYVEINRDILAPDVDEQTLRTLISMSDVDLAGLGADPGLKLTLNMYARASSNQLRLALAQQEKARAVLALLGPGKTATGGPP